MSERTTLSFSRRFVRQVKEKAGVDLAKKPVDFAYDFLGGSFKLEVTQQESLVTIELPALDLRFGIYGQSTEEYSIFRIAKTNLAGELIACWSAQQEHNKQLYRLQRELMIICVYLL